jgi:hypothetical protein
MPLKPTVDRVGSVQRQGASIIVCIFLSGGVFFTNNEGLGKEQVQKKGDQVSHASRLRLGIVAF